MLFRSISADQAVAESQRKLDLRNAEIQKETDKARAEAAAARPLAESIAMQGVIAQDEINAASRVGLRKQELDAEIRAVADAEAYSLEKKAEASAAAAVAAANSNRDARKASSEAVEAEGLAERNRRRSAAEATEAEGIAEKNRRIAAAEALRAEGEAEANSIRVKGAAEAEATRAKADALEERADDLLRQQVIAQLPDIVRAAAEPLGAIDHMTVISSDGKGTEQVGQNVASQLATSTQIVKDLTGIDIAEIVTGRATGAAVGESLKSERAPRVPAAATAPVGAPTE